MSRFGGPTPHIIRPLICLDDYSLICTISSLRNRLAKRHFKRDMCLGALNGVTLNLALAFTSPSAILPLFMSQLTTSPVLLALASTQQSAGWFLPEILMAWITPH